MESNPENNPENNGSPTPRAQDEPHENLMDIGDDSTTENSSSTVDDIEQRCETVSVESVTKNHDTTVASDGAIGQSESKMNEDDSDDEFYYISEDEWEEMNQRNPHFSTVPSKESSPSYSPLSHQAPSSTMNSSANLAPSSSGASTKEKSQAFATTSMSNKSAGPSSQPEPASHHSFIELFELGRFVEIDPNSEIRKLISIYASKGIGPKLTVTVQKIFRKEKEHSKLSVFELAKKGLKDFTNGSSNNGFKMLLWCKTTPESIKKLAQSKNSCMAFYDRMYRALPLPKIHETKETLHERILLCVVDLGQMYKSPHGYPRWCTETCAPPGYRSVKGMGKFRPNWHQNQEIEGAIVPCGKTERDTRFQNFELDFNEYFVYRGKQIDVQFAVDVEISHK